MPTLSSATIADLLRPYYPHPSVRLLEQLSTYLDLLCKWNARTNLTSIRSPEMMVTRHFGESLFVARHLPPAVTLLDLGSGAGFPGLPIALAHPALQVTLAESQQKKVAFLREVIRSLDVTVTVWPRRIEAMPPESRFDLVTLRAVDEPALALKLARLRVRAGGTILQLGASDSEPTQQIPVPNSDSTVLGFLS